jgi:hypothetical protein
MNFIQKIFPSKITNKTIENKIPYFVFIAITALTIIRSLVHIFAPDGGAQSIAGFPLDTYPEAASSMIILIFSLWGASQLLMGIVYVVVIFRYKSFIAFMYLLILIEYLSRYLLGVFKPAISTHVIPGGVLDYVMIPLSLIMLLMLLMCKVKES